MVSEIEIILQLLLVVVFLVGNEESSFRRLHNLEG